MSANSKFFDKPQPAAILKHQVLFRYLKVFASKTGSQSGGHVHFVDGYAGAGQYSETRELGSPGHAMVIANEMAKTRQLHLTFVEADRDTYVELVQFVDGTDTSAIPDPLVKFGKIEEHLEEILASARDEPLFLFLDPFGVGVPFDVLTKKILGRSRNNRPKTEVLLNFSVQAVDRMGGMLHSEARNAKATLQRLDDTLGGDWWRSIYEGTTGTERLGAIAEGYFQRVSAAAGGWSGWRVPVSDNFGKRPEYLLMHFTQHQDGRWEFHEALSFATAVWRAAVHDAFPTLREQQERQGQLGFDLEEAVPFEEDETAWVDEIAENARELLRQGPFVVQEQMVALAGRGLGMVRNTHFYKGLTKVYNEGLIEEKPRSTGLQRATIRPKQP
jgi:three-Cys-motif partner protein